MRRYDLLSILAFVVFLFPCLASAGEADPDAAGLYVRDRITLQAVTGPMFSSSFIGPDNPGFDTWQTNVRLGWMLTSPRGDGRALDGNMEVLLEITNSFVTDGFGDYVGGVAGLIRYNITGDGDRFVPYVQAGLGLVYSDAYKDRSQDAIGQAVSFSIRTGAGFCYLLARNWSLDAEAAYEHISNAGMDDRNNGVNAFGGFVGVTYFWDDLWK